MNLKQVTGRDHQDMQRYMVPLIAGAVPKGFLITVCSLMDFRYLAQSRAIDEDACTRIRAALSRFHIHKESIIQSGGHCGKKNIINNWYIPKLEFMQSVAPSIIANSVAIQWSTDVTERTHITVIKDPASAMNNHDYESQICCHLDQEEKCHHFDLATTVHAARTDLHYITLDSTIRADLDVGADSKGSTSSLSLVGCINPVSQLAGTSHKIVNYFEEADKLQWSLNHNAPTPFCTFADAQTAFRLNYESSFKHSTADQVSLAFKIPDLCAMLSEYITQAQSQIIHFTLGG